MPIPRLCLRPAPHPVRVRRVRFCPSPRLEPLERRHLLSGAPGGTSTLTDGHWVLRGTRRSDAIVVEPSPDDPASLRATVKGNPIATVPVAGLASIEVFAGAGNDAVTVRLPPGIRSPVTVHGERGRDEVSGSDASDTLDGGPGADHLSGNRGDDTLDGGPGNDVLTGGVGADTLRGGRGRDRFFRQGGVDAAAVESKDVVTPDTVGPLTRLDSDGEIRQWLTDAAVRQYKWAFDQPAGGWVYVADADGAVRTMGSAAAVPPGAPGAPVPGSAGDSAIVSTPTAGSGFSQTNIQTQGVDEADLVETDGTFLYTLRHPASQPIPMEGGAGGAPVIIDDSIAPVSSPIWQDELVIASAAPADAMAVASRTKLDGSAVGLYLVGTRLAVVSTVYDYRVFLGGDQQRLAAPLGAAIIEPGRPRVTLSVFDVSNPAAPALVEKTEVRGSYDTSRAVGDRVYVVVRNDTWPPPPNTVDAGDGSGQVYESEASYRARLAATPLSDLLPGYTASAGGADTTGTLATAGNVYVKDVTAQWFGQNMASVSVFNVGDAAAGPTATTTITGWAGPVFASADAIYLSSTYTDGEGADATQKTSVFKYSLLADAVPLAASGEVEGTVLSQYSMDQDAAGRLRVATTSRAFTPGVESTSGVYVLEQSGTDLRVIGSVTGLGRTEQIRSVRFVGDAAYVVTFRQIDPLFVIDLSDRTKPKLGGELTMPGFSTYLHPAGTGLLLGLGRDADDLGRVRGLQLALFDVSNPAKPKRLDVESIDLGGAWSGSTAEYDPHAFSYFPEQGVVAVPVDLVSDTGGTGHRLVTFRVTGEGLVPQGETTLDEMIVRSLRIGGVLYAVGNDTIKAVSLDDPSTQVGLLDLREKAEGGT
jgi:uncharacterized secreted protein with C-terminal beta-propeller domain